MSSNTAKVVILKNPTTPLVYEVSTKKRMFLNIGIF